ncbi:Eukaryotic translation initiation factor 2 alpha subunit family protein [Tritrichomonas foetus]|uniref:Eukaryotic translation initiation factor 2 alpha subunit family protein n=1 Tax=Tritrichomonas foetus TaxID=1144522 RepID=A0A1J4KIX1_9EUKA|nr:Eukaryotic translation initiation factor 2 alpha subunit family protein [Tritrichomonas foetus]|eukprot:OHT11034.1 Eukaryotic translation initiation factor 2 alpha subunit family protein [Tritrichomonas foetus]
MTTQNNSIYTVHWYPNEYPKEHEPVIVRLTRVDEMGIWVELLEYASKEGMIPLGQYTTRKTRRVPKNVKVGKVDTALVSQVDSEKGNMDLTRQGLKEEDIENAQKRFNDYKNLMNLIQYLCSKVNDAPFPDLVRQIVYPLHEKYGNAYIALQKSYHQPEIVADLQLSPEIQKVLTEQVQKMFTPTEVRIHGLFEAEVLTPAGVDALRDALVSGYDLAPKDSNLSLTVIAPPVYSISIDVFNAEQGTELLNKVLEQIKGKIDAVKGRFAIKEAPKVINQTELAKFQAKLDELAIAGEQNVDMDELND